MSRLYLFRLALDFLAASLLIAAYAYNWLGNATHEVIGTTLFALLITHNISNRRWYGTIVKRRREARSVFAKVINLLLLGAMLSLLATSVIISQTVFSFLAVETSFTARQAHTLVAYGALLIVALHLGLQWSMIMGLVRSRLGIANSDKVVWVMRVCAALIAIFGIHSLMALDIFSKLSMEVPTGFAAFEISTPALLLHHLAIVGLGICVVHSSLRLIQAARGKFAPV
ncbi:MAG: DUF4405 domain-containing protein [Microvirga sp.]